MDKGSEEKSVFGYMPYIPGIEFLAMKAAILLMLLIGKGKIA